MLNANYALSIEQLAITPVSPLPGATGKTEPSSLTPNSAVSKSVPSTEQSSADEWMRGCQCPMSAVTDETCPPLPPTPHFAADRPIGPNPGLAAHFTQCQSIKYKYSSDGPRGPNLG